MVDFDGPQFAVELNDPVLNVMVKLPLPKNILLSCAVLHTEAVILPLVYAPFISSNCEPNEPPYKVRLR